jgi:uncharacterized membrane protein
MLDDAYTHRNVIAVSFPEEANAYEAFSRLKELDSSGDIGVHGAAVVARESDGKIVVKDQFGEDNYENSVGGGLLGLLIGVLGGPLGILIGGATGLLVGSLFDEDEDDETDSALSEISKAIRVGPPGLLGDVSEPSPEAIDAVMAHLGGAVVRRSTADVETEVADAEHVQREAKKKARKELREARQKKHKQDVDAKLAELKSKLHKHPRAAAPTP